MNGLELILQFKADKAYLTSDKTLSFNQLGLPEIAKSFKAPAYWLIYVINYIAPEQKLYCKIVSYHVGEIEFSDIQKQFAEDLNKVEIVTFRSIDTFGLFATLKGSGSLTPEASRPVYRTPPYFAPPEPRIRTISETFYVPIKNIHFKLGGVSFSKKLKEHTEPLDLVISNHEIIEEFDAVKNYSGMSWAQGKLKLQPKLRLQTMR